ncbi:portal protein [Burkholderia sp. SRS-46]|nr:portal protein [Burkholderia sp. SRS-46]
MTVSDMPLKNTENLSERARPPLYALMSARMATHEPPFGRWSPTPIAC